MVDKEKGGGVYQILDILFRPFDSLAPKDF